MSDFTWLCETHGMSAGDPDAIDRLIDIYGEDDEPERCTCGRFVSPMGDGLCAVGKGCMK